MPVNSVAVKAAVYVSRATSQEVAIGLPVAVEQVYDSPLQMSPTGPIGLMIVEFIRSDLLKITYRA